MDMIFASSPNFTQSISSLSSGAIIKSIKTGIYPLNLFFPNYFHIVCCRKIQLTEILMLDFFHSFTSNKNFLQQISICEKSFFRAFVTKLKSTYNNATLVERQTRQINSEAEFLPNCLS